MNGRGRRRLVALLAVAVAVIVLVIVARASGQGSNESRATSPAGLAARQGVARDYWLGELRRRWLAERRDGRARARTIRRQRRTIRGLRVQLRQLRKSPPAGTHWLEAAFLCIHRHEGRWTDPGAPYYGGLQMDADFQSTYGVPYVRAFGTADNWPVSVQLAVAIRGYLERGFKPWPNTRRMCGL